MFQNQKNHLYSSQNSGPQTHTVGVNLCVMYVVLLLDLLILQIVCFNKFCSVTVICLFKEFKNAIMKAFLMPFMETEV